MSEDDKDDVGYRKPPKRSRFRPGQSGNPAGRPRLATNFRTALLAELAKVIDGGSMTKQDALIRSLVDRAIGGNIAATTALLPILMKVAASQAPADEATAEEREMLEDFMRQKGEQGREE